MQKLCCGSGIAFEMGFGAGFLFLGVELVEESFDRCLNLRVAAGEDVGGIVVDHDIGVKLMILLTSSLGHPNQMLDGSNT